MILDIFLNSPSNLEGEYSKYFLEFHILAFELYF